MNKPDVKARKARYKVLWEKHRPKKKRPNWAKNFLKWYKLLRKGETT